jgi:hypothetical protein
MKSTWRTLWQQQDIVVYRDDVEVDRFSASRIESVYSSTAATAIRRATSA